MCKRDTWTTSHHSASMWYDWNSNMFVYILFHLNAATSWYSLAALISYYVFGIHSVYYGFVCCFQSSNPPKVSKSKCRAAAAALLFRIVYNWFLFSLLPVRHFFLLSNPYGFSVTRVNVFEGEVDPFVSSQL